MRHSPKNYLPHIDGLRSIAVMSVVIHHIWPTIVPGGYVGVDIFFVISGYLIAGIIKREIEENNFSFIHFYERRARRIFPALFAVLIFCLILGYFVFLPSDYFVSLKGILGTLFFISNVVFWKDLEAGYFAETEAGLNPIVHTWSLSVEEQFYIFFPILLIFLYRIKIKKIPIILMIIFFFSLFISEYFLNTKPVAVFFLSPFRFWELLAGVLLAFNIIPDLKNRLLREVLMIAGLIALLYPCFAFSNSTEFPGINALLPVLGSVIIINFGKKENSYVRSILNLTPLVYIGLISYSLYLWHWPVVVFSKYLSGNYVILENLFLVFIISLCISIFSYHKIEQPFRGIKGSEIFSRNFVFSISATLILMIGSINVYGIAQKGFQKRFSEKIIQFDEARKPNIKYKYCDDLSDPMNWCVLGNKDNKVQTLFFGDSHLMSWAHGLDDIYKTKDHSAILAMLSACPPIFRLKSIRSEFRKDDSCSKKNFEVEKYLNENPSIKNVVLVGVWSEYFNGSTPINIVLENNIEFKNTEGAIEGTKFTIKKIKNMKKNIILIGPVPIYQNNVPFTLAINTKQNNKTKKSTLKLQREFNSKFFELVDSYDGDLKFIDPLSWICNPNCLIEKDNRSLYFDSNHLNELGSLYFGLKLKEKLDKFLIN
jgi:peptidoglycan/LPS O-acetylase OafA/YrhL